MTTPNHPAKFVIREASTVDAEALLAINQASTPGVGAASLQEIQALLAMSWRTFVAQDAPDAEGEAILGFLLTLRPGCAYDSPNYRWFEQRGGDFIYVDRIAVATEARGRRVGEALYGALLKAAAPGQPIACEVNSLPPNPGSMRFHGRFGFREVGRAAHTPGEKEVVYLERA